MADTGCTCPGCGAVLPDIGPSPHSYIGASGACWARYGELLVTVGGGQAAVDTYAVQHPGVPERRSIQSVAVHLMSLCAQLERGWPGDPRLLQRLLARPPTLHWLDPPTPNGTITVVDVSEGRQHRPVWTADVWGAWWSHHAKVRAWLDAATG